VTDMRTQSVAARAVAEAVADLVAAPATGGGPIVEVAGPREDSLVDMATLFAARRGLGVKIEGVRDPDDPDLEVYVGGGLLPGPDAILAGPTFEEWLDA
jgi:uncharacterized protein YbjT (DUF2867 family)